MVLYVTKTPEMNFNMTGSTPQCMGEMKSRVMKFSQAPLPYDMKYRIYMFSSETERLAALDDTRNTGLKYAKEMKGENGCDVEIVYEFFPKPGGGISVSLAQVMGCTIPEDENKEECKKKSRAIADSTSAYISNDVVVVQVKQSTLRESQYLPVRGRARSLRDHPGRRGRRRIAGEPD
jgi:hypothetical protein